MKSAPLADFSKAKSEPLVAETPTPNLTVIELSLTSTWSLSRMGACGNWHRMRPRPRAGDYIYAPEVGACNSIADGIGQNIGCFMSDHGETIVYRK